MILYLELVDIHMFVFSSSIYGRCCYAYWYLSGWCNFDGEIELKATKLPSGLNRLHSYEKCCSVEFKKKMV